MYVRRNIMSKRNLGVLLAVDAWVEEVNQKNIVKGVPGTEEVKFTTYVNPNEDDDSPKNEKLRDSRDEKGYVALEFELEITDPKKIGKFEFGKKYTLSFTEA
jgi:hypothetical protein